MANPVYPASNNAEAIALNISNANQFFTVLQGDIDDSIPTYEGNGEIPSVAKALNEAAAYRVPLPWQTTGEETDLMQPYEYNNNVYVPISVPASFSTAPDENFWRLYSIRSLYDVVSESYFTGIEITQHNQVIKDGDFYWQVSPGTTLPYTTTGAGLPEGGAFVSVGDAVLRQELGASTAAQGSDLMAHTGTSDTVTEALDKRTIYVGSVVELEGLSLAVGTNAYLTEEGRHGEFVVKTGTAPSDPEKALYIVLANGNYAERLRTEWQAAWFLDPGQTDFTTPLSNLENISNQGQKVRLPDRTLEITDGYTDKLQLIGNSKESVLKAGTGASRIIDFGRHIGPSTSDWDYHKIENINFDGNSKSSDGVAFNDENTSADELGGRWSFENCRFKACNKAVFHETGNIGNRYINCSFVGNDFGYYMVNPADGAIMHTGATTIDGGEINSTAKAGIFIDDGQDGTGGFRFKDVIIENNPGFGIFMNLRNKVPFSGVVFDNVWLEDNHNAATVDIDGTTYTPRDIRLDNVVSAEFRGMYLKSLELNNSKAIASNCRIDDASPDGLFISIDSDSSLVCDNLFMIGRAGPEPFVRSIATQQGASNNVNYSVRGPLANSYMPISGSLLYGNNFNGAGPWTFVGTVSRGATSVSDGVISDTCAELVINNGETLLGPDSGTPTVGKWAVWGVHAKLMSGSLSVATLGQDYTFGEIYLKAGQWVRSYGIQQVGGTSGASRINLVNNTGAAAAIRLADHYVVEFDTFEDAIEFCNARAAVRI